MATERNIVGESSRAGGPDSTAGETPTQAPEIPSEHVISSLLEDLTRAQAETTMQLLNSILSTSGEFRASTPPATTTTPGGGDFTKFTARFSHRPTPRYLRFVDAVEIYKKCATVSDEHALRRLPVLLEGEAVVWWRGVRSSIETWTDALARLRTMYGVLRPAYKIFREIKRTMSVPKCSCVGIEKNTSLHSVRTTTSTSAHKSTPRVNKHYRCIGM